MATFIENEWISGRIDTELFTKESRIHRHFDNTINDGVLANWLEEVNDYRRLDDDETITSVGNNWQQRLDAIYEDIQWLKDRKSKQAETLTIRANSIKEKMKFDKPYIAKYQTDFRDLDRDIGIDLTRMEHEIKSEKSNESREACEWLAIIKSIKFNSATLQDEWQTQIGQILGAKTCTHLKANPDTYVDIRAKLGNLKQSFSDLTEAFPSALDMGNKNLSGWRKQFILYAGTQREIAIRSALELFDRLLDTSSPNSPNFMSDPKSAELRQAYLNNQKPCKIFSQISKPLRITWIGVISWVRPYNLTIKRPL